MDERQTRAHKPDDDADLKAVAAESLTRTKLRVLQRDGKRTAVRLEEIFWSQLEDLAAAENVKLSSLVFRIFDNSADETNRTSLLRSYCLAKLRRDRELSLDTKAVNLLGLMEACPTPALALTSERRVFAYNAAFGRDFIVKPQSSAIEEQQNVMRLVFNRPFNQTLDMLKSNNRNSVSGIIGIASGDKLVQRKASFCLIGDRRDTSPVLVFIHPGL